MQYRPLGRSGLLVSELGLGTLLFGANVAHSTPREEAGRILDSFVERGGNLIDSANVYGEERAEEVLGSWLRGKARHNLILVSKAGMPRGRGPNLGGLTRSHLMQEAANSLRKLGTDYIDLYMLHLVDDLTPLEESLRALEDLVQRGMVRYIGLSGFRAWQVMKALSISSAMGWNRFVAAEYIYNLCERTLEYEYLSLFESEGIGLLAASPLAGGFLTGKYRRGAPPSVGRLSVLPEDAEDAWWRRDTPQNWTLIEALGQVGQVFGKTVSQVALAWMGSRRALASSILGPRTMGQMEDNLGSADFTLPIDHVTWLDQVSAPPDLYPYRALEAFGAERRSRRP